MKILNSLAECDFLLIVPAVLIFIFGLLSLYSIDSELARAQLAFALFGGVCFCVVSVVNYRWLRHAALPVFALAFVLLLGVLIFGEEVGGATRWFSLGSLFFSPAELAKVALIILLSCFLTKDGAPFGLRDLVIGIAPTAALMALVMLQPSLGTALVIGAVWLGVVWAAGIPFRHLVLLFLLATTSLPIVWANLESYQRSRIMSFLDPLSDPLGAGYNVIQAVIAVGSGQLFGKGFGMGTQSHLQFLPVRHTDFIFSSLVEEWGLLGAGILIVLFGILLWRILRIASLCQDRSGLLLGVGTFALFFSQVVINVGMNVGVAPVTGLPLPFVSYGGSSLLFSFMALGLVHSLALHREV